MEGMIKIVYDLLKDKLNIAKITFTSGVNAASAEFETHNQIERCRCAGLRWTRTASARNADIGRDNDFGLAAATTPIDQSIGPGFPSGPMPV